MSITLHLSTDGLSVSVGLRGVTFPLHNAYFRNWAKFPENSLIKFCPFDCSAVSLLISLRRDFRLLSIFFFC